MGDGRASEPRYTAFLSYSHKDAAAAGRLHRRLETYRMPRRLVGTDTARGPVPARLAPIFRDREELPAATDLSTTVREALAQSGALIVLCSPAAAASLWVAEEIETFRKLHPDRPVLAAVLDGDPPDCFPQALRAFGPDGTWHEPLATDLRRHRDGRRLGLLKLVAGITGVGLDALVQRDATRRIRRVMAVTAVALVAMLAMAALALVAINARGEVERQRAEAERQRAAAEGLVDFMLTELRTRLRRSVGSVPVMQAVNLRALRYYGAQRELGRLPADSLERRARVLHAMGEDYITSGDTGAALAAFLEARRTTAEQLARSPNDPQRIFDHAQSDYWVGRVHELREDWPEAGRQFRLYAVAAERLIAIAPNNPGYILEMAYGMASLGRVRLKGEHDPAGAQALFERSTTWFERAIRLLPGEDEPRIGLANAYANIADTFHARARWRPSLAFRIRQYELMARLQSATPDDVEKFYRLGLSERALARMAELAGDRAKVSLFRSRAYQKARQLTERDPSNADWLLFRTSVECDLLIRPGRRAQAGSEAQLRRNIAAAGARLRAQRNPRMSEISYCLGHLQQRAAITN